MADGTGDRGTQVAFARPTIRDVARHAGVSKSTVSVVLRGGPVRPETAARVRTAVARLGYVHDGRAVRFRTGGAGPIGVALAPLDDPLVAGVLTGLSAAASEAGRALLLAAPDDPGQAATVGAENPVLPVAARLRAEGAAALVLDGRAGRIGPIGPVPGIALGRADGSVPSACLDAAQAFRLARSVLAAGGATRFVIAGASPVIDPGAPWREASWVCLRDAESSLCARLGKSLGRDSNAPTESTAPERWIDALDPADGVVCLSPASATRARACGMPAARIVTVGAAHPGAGAWIAADTRDLGRRIGRALIARCADPGASIADIAGPVWLRRGEAR
ncbi:LacI family DNA-binding transcriptional regulator [Roseivivax jejudonensis]|uniref:LacI family DNA-binding transcriptional regulator n=1 Tax=Roseivivax jejudonensis TaxID=1529041 RepID=UPI001F447E74|nr:LacI family DNA-binding transcriptional regulator [Roseivivax jejudonensis]